MIKLEIADHEDLRYSVDPHLVQPTLEDLLIERNSERSCSASPEDVQPLPIVDGSVQMEHCINLDLYLAPIRDTMESFYTDELDTPDTFVSAARNDPNKIINTTTHQKQSDGNPFNFSTTAAQPIVIPTAKSATSIIESKSTTKSIQNTMINFTFDTENSKNQMPESYESMADPWSNAADGSADCGSLLSPNHFDSADINMEEYDFLLDCQDAIDADVDDANNASNSMDYNNATHAAPIEAAHTINEHHNYALNTLKLNIDHLANLQPQMDVLQTPDIISTILQFENPSNLNNIHVKFVSAEEIKEELEELALSPTHSDNSPQPQTPDTYAQDDESSMQSSIASTSTAAVTVRSNRGRRRKQVSDDEEYIPPEKTARKTTKRRVNLPIKVEDSDEEYTPAKIPKRGRPAKPVSARSSESSECSRYREMRDKNNEASRRSRRKRRLQEQTIEEDCEVLNEKNLRLKAQVSELENSVAVYRNNLMKLLLNKA